MAALSVIWVLNAGFLTAADRHLGGWFAVRAALFLPAMYFYHGVGLVAGLAAYAFGRSAARHRPAPDPTFRVIEPE